MQRMARIRATTTLKTSFFTDNSRSYLTSLPLIWSLRCLFSEVKERRRQERWQKERDSFLFRFPLKLFLNRPNVRPITECSQCFTLYAHNTSFSCTWAKECLHLSYISSFYLVLWSCATYLEALMRMYLRLKTWLNTSVNLLTSKYLTILR